MDIEEYIEKASENIKNKKVRDQFKKELYGHILDRAEFYTDSGYDEETALSKTLEQMGEPEAVSEEMKKVHGKVEKIEYVLLILLILFSMFVLAVTFFFNLAAGDRNVNSFPLLEIIFAVLVPLGMRAYGRRYKAIGPLVLMLIETNLIFAYRFATVLRSFNLLALQMLLTGHLKDFKLLDATWLYNNSFFLAAATVAVFIAVDVIDILIIITTAKDAGRPTARSQRISAAIKRFLSVAAAVSVAFSIFTFAVRVSNVQENEEYDRLIFVESDEMTDIKKLDYQKEGIGLRLDYDLFVIGVTYAEWDDFRDCEGSLWTVENRPAFAENEFVDFKYIDSGVYKTKYGRKTIRQEFTPSKRYTAVIPVDSSYDIEAGMEIVTPDYSLAKWFDTENTDVMYGELDNRQFCQLDYKIKVTDDEMFLKAKEMFFEEKENEEYYQNWE